MWITNGTIADVALVWAKDDDGVVRGFLIEKGMEGFSAPEQHGKLSLRASITSELVLENVRVPDSVECCRAIGFDMPRWMRKGLIDMLFVISRSVFMVCSIVIYFCSMEKFSFTTASLGNY